jgi:hypothetical protein
MYYSRRTRPFNKRNNLANEPKLSKLEALALCAMATRVNDGEYVKHTDFVARGNGEVEKHPNREIIKMHRNGQGGYEVTKADQDLAVKLLEHFEGLAFDVISGSATDFDRKVLSILENDEVGAVTDMALLASLPARYSREIERGELDEALATLAVTSTFQGTVGEKMDVDLEILAVYPGRTFAGSVCKATDGTNMYFWTSARMADLWHRNTPIRVRGSVKQHFVDERTNAKTTRLTRVKEVLFATP